MAKKLGFLVNSDRCIGCHACEMACKNEYQQPGAVRWRKVYALKEESFGKPAREFASLACNHCQDPACLKACPAKAYTKREDGIVLHHQERCLGCQMCIMACPYRAPVFNEKTKKVEKCRMCAEKLDNGEKPACVSGCPMEALAVIDLANNERPDMSKNLPGFPDTRQTNPSVRFINPVAGVQVRREK